jgi:hypothetical protein
MSHTSTAPLFFNTFEIIIKFQNTAMEEKAVAGSYAHPEQAPRYQFHSLLISGTLVRLTTTSRTNFALHSLAAHSFVRRPKK